MTIMSLIDTKILALSVPPGIKMPYKAMLAKLRERMKTERNPKKIEEYQLAETLLLGIIELQMKLERLTELITGEK